MSRLITGVTSRGACRESTRAAGLDLKCSLQIAFCFAPQSLLITRRRCRFSGSSKDRVKLFLSKTQNTATKKERIVVTTTMRDRYGEDFLSGGTATSTTWTIEPSRAWFGFATGHDFASNSKTVSWYLRSRYRRRYSMPD